jgi:RNA polymerase sigma-70 factor (ECF subfamily)
MQAQLASPLFPAVTLEGPRPRTVASWKHSPTAAADGWHDISSFQDKIFCLCLGFMGNAADARDLTQDTFAKALAHADQAPPEHMQAWLLCIARNSCLDHMRRFKVRGPLQPLSEFSAVCWQTPEDLAGSAEEIRIVRRAIARLPRRLRDVLVMREYGELSCQEISSAVGIGHGTVSKRLKRARQLVLRYYLEEQK